MFKTWYSTNVMVTFTYLLLLVLSTKQQMPIRDKKIYASNTKAKMAVGVKL